LHALTTFLAHGDIVLQTCEQYGPLWGFWCYPFENMLGYTKKFIHGTKTPERAFMFGTQVTRIMPVLENKTFADLHSKGHITAEEYTVHLFHLSHYYYY